MEPVLPYSKRWVGPDNKAYIMYLHANCKYFIMVRSIFARILVIWVIWVFWVFW